MPLQCPRCNEDLLLGVPHLCKATAPAIPALGPKTTRVLEALGALSQQLTTIEAKLEMLLVLQEEK